MILPCNSRWKTLQIVSIVLMLVATTAPFFSVLAQEDSIQFTDTVFTDTFSHGLDKWELVAGNLEYWEVVQNKLTAHVFRGSTRSMLVVKDKYWKPEWKDYEFSFEYTHLQGTDINFLFNYQDPKNWYEFHIKDGWYQVVRVQNGTLTFRALGELTIASGVTYSVKIRQSGNEISLFIDDRLIGVHSDWTYSPTSGGKVGLRATTGHVFPTKVEFESVRVSVPSSGEDQTPPVQSHLPTFKQTDPQWGSTIYDHANLWSETPYFGRWGCLVTSLTMIFNYYGMDTLPDGTTLTPASLNDWLRSQPDGYIGTGLVNWQAATRLTHALSTLNGTPKLEYTIVQGKSLESAYAAFAKNQPVIFSIPGHFLVGARRALENQNDVVIHDPFYNYDLLSKHGALQNTQSPALLNTRLLTPSFTDLSYFVFVHDPLVKITVHKENDDGSQTEISAITTNETIEPKDTPDSVTDVPSDMPTQSVTMFPKPESGSYVFKISSEQPKESQIGFYSYNNQAQVVIKKFTTWTTPVPLQYEISFDKTLEHTQQNPEQQHSHSSSKYSVLEFTTELYSIYHNYTQSLDWNSLYIILQILMLFNDQNMSLEQKKLLATQIVNQYEFCLPAPLISFLQSRTELLQSEGKP